MATFPFDQPGPEPFPLPKDSDRFEPDEDSDLEEPGNDDPTDPMTMPPPDWAAPLIEKGLAPKPDVICQACPECGGPMPPVVLCPNCARPMPRHTQTGEP